MLKYVFMPYRASKHSGVSGAYSAVSNRGLGGKVIFRSPEDLTYFTSTLKRLARQTPAVRVIAFSLLTTSFHLALYSADVEAISKFIHRLSISYSIYFNSRYETSGKVFAGPFKDRLLIGDDQLVQEVCRIHLLPSREHHNPETYEWSSYRSYLSGQAPWVYKQDVVAYFRTDDLAKALRHLTDTQRDTSDIS
jgi:hypothetical protein